MPRNHRGGHPMREGEAGGMHSLVGRPASAAVLALLLSACTSSRPPAALASRPPPDPQKLSEAASFSSIADRAERSRALFLEASRVFLHPRCANCHPDGDTPAQGMDMRVHDPPVLRGAGDDGVVAMRCTGCHQDHNLELARVPGAPHWQLAPRKMAWVGR